MYDDQLILPTDLAGFGGTAGPKYLTKIVSTPSGVEYRDTLRGYELGRYIVPFQAMFKSSSNGRFVSWQEMYAFFRVAQGMGKSFRAKDPLDYTVSSVEGKFIATAVSNKWQCVKRYQVGSSYRDRIITKIGGSYSSTAGTIDPATGLCTNTTMPASWTCSLFYVQVRFDTDEMLPKTFTNSGGQPVLGWEDLPVVEVRE